MQAWLDSFVIVNLAGMYTELCLPCICLYLTFFFSARPSNSYMQEPHRGNSSVGISGDD